MASKKQFGIKKAVSNAVNSDRKPTEVLDDPLDSDDAVDIDFSSREDRSGIRTVAARQVLHDKLTSEVEAFLARGGKIDQVPSFVSADPPKRPVNKYGQHSL